MRLLLVRPELANRDCKLCEKYLFDDNGPVLVRDKLRLRPKHKLPACRTKGCPKGLPNAQNSLSPDNLLCYRHYQRCKVTGRWPDDPLVLYHARIISEIERDVWESMQLQTIRNALSSANA